VLSGDQLGLGCQKLLVLDEDFERRARTDQRLLLHSCEGNLRRAHRRRK
jgi:hypothetical protein